MSPLRSIAIIAIAARLSLAPEFTGGSGEGRRSADEPQAPRRPDVILRYQGYGEELYDLGRDPGELRNLAGEASAAAERARLARELDEWMRRTGDPFPQLTPTDRSGVVLGASRGSPRSR